MWLVFIPASLFQGQSGFDKTLSAAVARAQSEQRQLMLYFTSNKCEDCRTLDAYLAQETVQSALDAKYVSARVDIEAFDGKACGQIYGISDVPAVVIVKPDGTITSRREGDLSTSDIESLIINGVFPGPETKKPGPAETAAGSEDQHGAKSYALQVGFFSSMNNAVNLKNQIESKGFSEARVAEEERDNKTYYRVLVGDYSSAQFARTDMKTLEKSGFSVKVHKNSR